MITDSEKNKIYLSKLLSTEEKYLPFWNRFEPILSNDLGLQPIPLKSTNDIWCRDFMPIQLNENQFLKLKYDPDYLKPKKHQHLWTDTNHVLSSNEIETEFNFSDSDLILDGGNILVSMQKQGEN